VVSQVNGAWQPPIPVRGLPALDAGGAGSIDSVSCASPGDCAAGGSFTPWGHGGAAFVISQVDGTWGSAQAVIAGAGLDPDGLLAITSMSCSSAGDCTAAGTAWSNVSVSAGFAVREVHGTWSLATPLRTPYQWRVWTLLLSCASAGACAAAGYYSDPYNAKGFVITEARGIWGTARQDPRGRVFTSGADINVASLSCAPGGSCVAGGSYGTGINIPGAQDTEYTQAFLLTIR